MKYAVAYMNYFDNNLQIIIVDAENPVQAMVEGARTLLKAKDDDEWLNNFLKNIPAGCYAKRVEEIRDEFFNADQAIAVMAV